MPPLNGSFRCIAARSKKWPHVHGLPWLAINQGCLHEDRNSGRRISTQLLGGHWSAPPSEQHQIESTSESLLPQCGGHESYSSSPVTESLDEDAEVQEIFEGVLKEHELGDWDWEDTLSSSGEQMLFDDIFGNDGQECEPPPEPSSLQPQGQEHLPVIHLEENDNKAWQVPEQAWSLLDSLEAEGSSPLGGRQSIGDEAQADGITPSSPIARECHTLSPQLGIERGLAPQLRQPGNAVETVNDPSGMWASGSRIVQSRSLGSPNGANAAVSEPRNSQQVLRACPPLGSVVLRGRSCTMEKPGTIACQAASSGNAKRPPAESQTAHDNTCYRTRRGEESGMCPNRPKSGPRCSCLRTSECVKAECGCAWTSADQSAPPSSDFAHWLKWHSPKLLEYFRVALRQKRATSEWVHAITRLNVILSLIRRCFKCKPPICEQLKGLRSDFQDIRTKAEPLPRTNSDIGKGPPQCFQSPLFLSAFEFYKADLAKRESGKATIYDQCTCSESSISTSCDRIADPNKAFGRVLQFLRTKYSEVLEYVRAASPKKGGLASWTRAVLTGACTLLIDAWQTRGASGCRKIPLLRGALREVQLPSTNLEDHNHSGLPAAFQSEGFEDAIRFFRKKREGVRKRDRSRQLRKVPKKCERDRKQDRSKAATGPEVPLRKEPSGVQSKASEDAIKFLRKERRKDPQRKRSKAATGPEVPLRKER